MLYRVIRKIYLKFKLMILVRKGLVLGKNVQFTGFPEFGTEPYLIKIGDNVTVAGKTSFINHDGGKRVTDLLKNDYNTSRYIKFGRIEIGNNVFIGYNSIILPNTFIGSNTVIAAGSVVRGKLDSNSVYGGVPAKKIMSIEDYALKNQKNYYFSEASDYIQYRRNKKKFILEITGGVND